jgi:hypothetical protein
LLKFKYVWCVYITCYICQNCSDSLVFLVFHFIVFIEERIEENKMQFVSADLILCRFPQMNWIHLDNISMITMNTKPPQNEY